MNDITILVNSCDAYSDLWLPFFTLLKKYWPGEIPPIILNTETKDFCLDGLNIRCVHCPNNPKGYYGKRLKYALRQIDSKYVLCLLDDFFLRREVDIKMIDQLLQYMEENENISCFNFENVLHGKPSERYLGFISLPPIAQFRLNLQAAIWRKADFESYWKDRVDPWTWESVSNKLTYCTQKEFYFLEPGTQMPFDYGKKSGLNWGVVRGKWREDDVVPFFESEGIEVDYSKRGFFDESQIKQMPAKGMFTLNCQMLYILGPLFTFKNFCYSTIYRRICRLFGKSVLDFDAYLAQKYNQNW